MNRIHVYVLTPKDATSPDESVFEGLFFNQSGPYEIVIAEKRGPVPIAHCYLEVVVEGLTWAGQGVIGALAYELVKTLGRGLKKEFDTWTLGIRSGSTSENVHLNRSDEGDSTKRLYEVLEKMAEREKTKPKE